jgi:Flp pilus assembly protein TadG
MFIRHVFIRHATGRDQRGAQAVEFALITVILFPLLFGIIQYGIYFNDYLQARQAVRQGARTASVLATPACSSPSAGANTPAAMGCYTRAQTAPVSGPVAVRVTAPNGWVVGQPVLVCAAVKTADIVGILPMPNNGFVLAKTQMSIEQSTTVPTGFPNSDTDPTGKSWSWCS